MEYPSIAEMDADDYSVTRPANKSAKRFTIDNEKCSIRFMCSTADSCAELETILSTFLLERKWSTPPSSYNLYPTEKLKSHRGTPSYILHEDGTLTEDDPFARLTHKLQTYWTEIAAAYKPPKEILICPNIISPGIVCSAENSSDGDKKQVCSKCGKRLHVEREIEEKKSSITMEEEAEMNRKKYLERMGKEAVDKEFEEAEKMRNLMMTRPMCKNRIQP